MVNYPIVRRNSRSISICVGLSLRTSLMIFLSWVVGYKMFLSLLKNSARLESSATRRRSNVATDGCDSPASIRWIWFSEISVSFESRYTLSPLFSRSRVNSAPKFIGNSFLQFPIIMLHSSQKINISTYSIYTTLLIYYTNTIF